MVKIIGDIGVFVVLDKKGKGIVNVIYKFKRVNLIRGEILNIKVFEFWFLIILNLVN